MYRESLYGKRERVNLSNPQNPAQQIAAEFNPRLQVYEDPTTGIPLPQAQQGWLKESGVYHAPRETLQKIGVVKDEHGVDRFQVYDPNTGKYALTPGRAYERTADASLAEWRKDEAFATKETAIYTKYAANVQAIEARHNAEAERIGRDTSQTPDAKQKLLDQNEAQRKRALGQAEKDRNQVLDIHYRNHKKQFMPDGESGESTGSDAQGDGQAVTVPKGTLDRFKKLSGGG